MSKITRKRWTEAEEAYLLELYTEGTELAQIARALGRTCHAIRSRINHLNKAEVVDLGEFKPGEFRLEKPKPKPKARVNTVTVALGALTVASTLAAAILAALIWG